MKYVIAILSKTTAWIGVIGILILLVGSQTALWFLFIISIVVPETILKDIFNSWNRGLREVERDIEGINSTMQPPDKPRAPMNQPPRGSW